MMKTVFASVLIAVTCGLCLCDDDGNDGGSGIDAAFCVFSCLSAFERKGVEEGAALTTALPSGSDDVCDRLDLEATLNLCAAYQKADTCLRGCVNNPTKKIIISGLDYLCIHRISDFKKYMPCFKDKCSLMERQCGDSCGGLSRIEGDMLRQLGLGGNDTSDKTARRKRDAGVTDTTPDMDTTTSVTPSDKSDSDADPDPIDTCQFFQCYVNCSRPLLEHECGKDAYNFLRQTSNILLSFVMAPLEQMWAESSNTTLSETMNTCDGYFSEALTDVGVDRQALKSAAGRLNAHHLTILLLSAALGVTVRFL